MVEAATYIMDGGKGARPAAVAEEPDTGCGCRTVASPSSPGTRVLISLALGLSAVVRRRRNRAAELASRVDGRGAPAWLENVPHDVTEELDVRAVSAFVFALVSLYG